MKKKVIRLRKRDRRHTGANLTQAERKTIDIVRDAVVVPTRDLLAQRGWTPDAIERILGMHPDVVRSTSRGAGNPELAAATSKAPPHIYEATDALSGAQNNVHSLLELLASKMSPVLRSQPPATNAVSEATPTPPRSTPLGELLVEQVNLARSCCSMLRDLIDRLEV